MTPVDNAALRAAVGNFAANPGQQTIYEVLRLCMHGELLLDVTGSDTPQAGSVPFPAGTRIQIRGGTGPDGGRALFVFTGNEQISHMHPAGTQTQSWAQPAESVLALARNQGDRWLYIDPAGPTCALSAEEMDFALRNPNNKPLKMAIDNLAAGRVSREYVLTVYRQDGPLLLAADDQSAPGRVQMRSVTLPDHTSALVAFTSAPEQIAYSPHDAVLPLTARQVWETAIRGRHDAIIINPAGPSCVFGTTEIAIPRPPSAAVASE